MTRAIGIYLAACVIVAGAGCGAKTGLAIDEGGGRDAGEMRDARVPRRDAGADGEVPLVGCAGADVVVRYDSVGRPVPARVDLRATIRIAQADVYFLIDTTGSMVGEIAAMRATVLELIDALTCPSSDRVCSDDGDCMSDEACSPEGRCAHAPEIAGCLPDLHVGVGRYAGGPNSFVHLLSIAPPSDATRDAIPGSADGRGSDEALYQSVQCVFGMGRCPGTGCEGTGRECAGFRPRALPILVTITDEGDECTYGRFRECAATPESTGATLRENGAVFVGIDADARRREATPFLVALAEEAGSFDADGEPLVYLGAESGVVGAVQEGLGAVATSPLRLEVVLEEAAEDAGAALRFVDRVEVDTASPGCFAYRDLEDADGDGRPDVVRAAGPGTTGCFVVFPGDLPAGTEPGTTATLTARLLGGGATVDERTICFEVL